MKQSKQTDTIAAIATPMGEGGIGIVRLSGKGAVGIARRIFFPIKKTGLEEHRSHTIRYGHIKIPGTEEVVDEVLLTVMKGPATYTAEDVVEINCHGGPVPLGRVLALCISEGARLAEAGEFTKRAFLNGRIDLSQAEAVMDIIGSRSEMSRKIAASQLKGVFSEEIRKVRDMALDISSRIELAIDFTEEDVTFSSMKEIRDDLSRLRAAVAGILDTAQKGMLYRHGISVVICGKPNVGKSSLLNALLRRERAIVTPVAGTTRDTIEESVNISGIQVRMTDTAGITGTKDAVEMEGVIRSKEKIETANIIVLVIDVSRKLSDEDLEIFNLIRDKKILIVANKIDLKYAFDVKEAAALFQGEHVLQVSVLRDRNLSGIEDAITDKIFDGGNIEVPEGPVVANLRHAEALKEALKSIERAEKASEEKCNAELLASDLRETVHQLGLILGEEIEDGVLDRIFSQFCVGK